MNAPYTIEMNMLRGTWHCGMPPTFPSAMNSVTVTITHFGAISVPDLRLAVLRNGIAVAGSSSFTESGSNAVCTLSLATDKMQESMADVNENAMVGFNFKAYGAPDPTFSLDVWIPVRNAATVSDVPVQGYSGLVSLISEETVGGVTYIVIRASDGTVLQRLEKP
jgi:hypothetical protein